VSPTRGRGYDREQKDKRMASLMAALKSELKTLYHVAMAAATQVQNVIDGIEKIEAENRAAAQAKPVEVAPDSPTQAPPPKKAKKVAPKESTEEGARVLAGFTITPPAKKGQRMSLPSKEEITKKALSLGVSQEKIAEFFPAGVKPSNDYKLKALEHLDSLPASEEAPAPVPVPDAAQAPTNGVRVLAGFKIAPPAKKGARMDLPSKGEIAKKAVALGMAADEIAKFFPAGGKPSNEMKLKILERLDGITKGAPGA